MKILKQVILLLFLSIGFNLNLKAQADSTARPDIVDVIWMRDGSKLSGTIVKWELARGMEFKLLTGAVITIPQTEIEKVTVDIGYKEGMAPVYVYGRKDRPYAFREHGLYQTFSCFLNFSDPGGAGIHYSIGHRFTHLLGVGGGIGIESNDFFNDRGLAPVFAEARGFFLKAKISPYYAMKLGYGFALKNQTTEVIEAKGGIYFSPEIGVRFGGKNVNYYLGLEYKLQNATYTSNFGWGGDGTATDKVTYRRTELRTGLVF
ncbi:MAG TPA: hypothetical protein VN763_14340 [Saprospiraceae bacterium]|nr:hypothetical protein [Saprospiraceae bacterium]